MAIVKVTQQFDYYVPGVKMTSYDPKGGPNNDGFHDMPQHHLEAARKAGAIDEDAQPPVRDERSAADRAGADGSAMKIEGDGKSGGKAK